MQFPAVAENVKRRRADMGLSRERLAVAADTSVATLTRLENHGQAPSLPILERIAVALETTTAELLAETQRAAS